MTNSGHNHNAPAIPDTGSDSATAAGNSGNIPIDRVEWSRNTILEFIDDYRSFNVLWDPNTKGYHIKQIKYEALKQLSRKYGTEVRIIRSKIKSLRSSFHREHGKVISGKRRGVNYQPMWFAYEAIRFILDGERNDEMGGTAATAMATMGDVNNTTFDATCDTSVGGGGSGIGGIGGEVFAAAVAAAAAATAASAAATTAGAVCDDDVGADTVTNGIDAKDELGAFADQSSDLNYANISAGDVKTEIVESPLGEVGDLSRSHKSNIKKCSKSRKRRRLSKTDVITPQIRTESDTDSLASSSSSIPYKKMRKVDISEYDEFGVFGEYVGITIRRLKSSKAQVVIKHLINNLLFDAEMGKYDYGIPTSREPPHLYATTE